MSDKMHDRPGSAGVGIRSATAWRRSNVVDVRLETRGMLTAWRAVRLGDGWPVATWFLLPAAQGCPPVALPRLTGFTVPDLPLARQLVRRGVDPAVALPSAFVDASVFAPPRARDLRTGLTGQPVEIPIASVLKAITGGRDNGRRASADLDRTLELLCRIDLDGEAQGAVLAEDPWTDPDEAKKRLRRARGLLADHGVLPWAALPVRRLPIAWAAKETVVRGVATWWDEAAARSATLALFRQLRAA